MRRKALRHLGDKHPVYGTSLSITGSIQQMQSKFEDAEKNYRLAKTILEKGGTPAEGDLAEVYLNISDLFSSTNRLVEAKTYVEKGLAIVKRKHGANDIRTITAINNLGMTLYRLGQMDQAEARLSESLKLHLATFGADHAETASAQNNMGLLYTARGKYDKAEQAYRAAKTIAKQKFDPNHPLNASIKNNLGQLLAEQGKFDEAEPMLEEAVKFRLEKLGADDPATALAQHNLATLLVDLKQYDKARDMLSSAEKTLREVNGATHPLAIGSCTYQGILEAAVGNAEKAAMHFKDVRRNATESVWQQLPGLDSQQQSKLMNKTFNWTLYACLSLADSAGDNPKIVELASEWLVNGKGIAETALAAARNRKKTPDAATASLPWASLPDVRKSLPKNGVLIDIIRQDIINFDAGTYRERLQDPRYVVFVTPKQGPVKRIDLGDAAEIDKLVAALRKNVADAGKPNGLIGERGEIEAMDAYQTAAKELADVIWNPIGKTIDDSVEQLVLSPDGSLWLVPWSALPMQTEQENEKEQFLIERFSVSTTPSGRHLIYGQDGLSEKSSDELNKSRSAVFSNPEFDQSSQNKQKSYFQLFKRKPTLPAPGTRSLALGAKLKRALPLPGTEVESAAIMPRMAKWLDNEKLNDFKGEYALESVAKQLVRPKSLVFATHGFFNTKEASELTPADPLSRCGLLLAGCNDPLSVLNDDDGVLTGTEITSIDLRNTDLVVLSACETGVGEIENGNGIAGLRRAFHLAGAKSVASTLWQIPDMDTAKLMTQFFDGLATGKSKTDALRQAKLKRIAARRQRHGAAHPFFWAGFSISGQ
jgi:CHAT domain-containing protein/Tfp pilus assembly protein PilF